MAAAGQPAALQRSPSDTVREFYKAMREKRFREAWALSIYQPAVEGLTQEEWNELLPDFEKTALAVTQKVPANLQITNEVVSGDTAVVTIKIKDADEKICRLKRNAMRLGRRRISSVYDRPAPV